MLKEKNKVLMANNRFVAFTLAEVLITLAVIGIVAAMSIPTLMQQHQEKVATTALKKAYSTFSDAFKLAVKDNGDPTNWNLDGYISEQGALNLLNTMAPYLNITKNCGIEQNLGCWVPTNNLSGNTASNNDNSTVVSTAVLSDGTSIGFLIRSETCSGHWGTTQMLQNVCADIFVDINGKKAPNTGGKDVFRFTLTKYGIVPKGTENSTAFAFDQYCYGDSNINPTYGNGESCTAWVIYNENMDYLHCDDLSWSGKRKCS